jgi:hypothetical protein
MKFMAVKVNIALSVAQAEALMKALSTQVKATKTVEAIMVKIGDALAAVAS